MKSYMILIGIVVAVSIFLFGVRVGVVWCENSYLKSVQKMSRNAQKDNEACKKIQGNDYAIPMYPT